MAMSDLVKRLDDLCAKALKEGKRDVEAFWLKFAADVTGSIFREGSISKEAAHVFDMNATDMYTEIRHRLSEVEPENRPEVFEAMRSVVNEEQRLGRRSQEQSDLARRVIDQVETELGQQS